MDQQQKDEPTISPRRRRISLLVLFLLLAGTALYITDRKTQPRIVSGPMVQIPGPHTLAIVWKAHPASGQGAVTIRGSDGKELQQLASKNSEGRYEARFDDLPAGAKFDYTVQNSGLLGRLIQVSGPFSVATPQSRGKPFRFVAFGDSGSGSNAQASLAELIVNNKPDVVIHVGDLIYPAGRLEDYLPNFFQPNAHLVCSAPFMASLGNHDVATDRGEPLLKVFTLPENGPPGIEPERNYYFDYGDARFVALDSNTTRGGGAITEAQMKEVVAPWVRKVLTECDARWKFVFFHHPYYTGSTHSPAGGKHMKDAFARVFEECGVNVVFCGHNHLYERTSPIREDRIVPPGEGIVFITTGAGGASRYPEDEKPPAYMLKHADAVFSFTRVDLSGDRLELKQIGENGETLDEWVKEKSPPTRSS